MATLALEGLRIVDFGWVLAGPYATKLLADQGAQVIKIETNYRVDGIRAYGPWKGGVPHPPDGSGFFDAHNRNKMSMLLNLNTAVGVQVCKRLIVVSDVALENFSVRAMRKFGLEYPVLREINPRLIMISMAGMGQTGPRREYLSFGPTLQPMSGLTHLTGYPGRPPVGIGNSYPDFVAGLHAAVAILAALEYRDRTGRGQYIDLSQLEATVGMIGPAILDYVANGRLQEAVGNRSPFASPHGCYPCRGEDRWCVISVSNDQEWADFCRALGQPPWTQEERFATTLIRVQHADELDRLVAAWTLERTAEEAVETLQAHGVPAGVVQTTEDLITKDSHLRARGFYEEVEHPITGRAALEGIPYKLSETPGSVRCAAPLLGQHTEYVLRDILQLSDEEIADYAAQGAFE